MRKNYILYNKFILNIGYEFKDTDLLHQALTHSSAAKPSYERLEFLGDSILNFIIAEELFRLHPDYEEGQLSRIRANLVNGKMLAEMALEFSLNKYIQLGAGEKRMGGATRESTLADCFEAIIGAMYLDSNIDICRKYILERFKSRLEMTSVNEKDPKTMLQEYLQSHKMPLPIYEIIKTEGAAHAQIFHVICRVGKNPLSTSGTGRTRRQAEQDAAAKYLAVMV